MIFLLATNLVVVAQTRQQSRRAAPVRNRAISNIVREIDARNIEATIRKLVSFGTRNTLSEQNDPKRGIGAARDWLYAEFLKAAEASKAAYQKALAAKGLGSITTEILPAGEFYFAEDYHQQYLAKNPAGYCGLGGTGVSCPIGAGVSV